MTTLDERLAACQEIEDFMIESYKSEAYFPRDEWRGLVDEYIERMDAAIEALRAVPGKDNLRRKFERTKRNVERDRKRARR